FFLGAHLDRAARLDLEPARVDDDEPAAVPLRVAIQAIARRPRAILDDRRAGAKDAIEQRALADVRSADDGNHRERGHVSLRRRRLRAVLRLSAGTWSCPREWRLRLARRARADPRPSGRPACRLAR